MPPSIEVCRCALALPPGSVPDTLRADVPAFITHLYVCEGLSTYRIGELAGMHRQRVGRLLARTGVPVKPRGSGRRRRIGADQEAADEAMARLYIDAGLTSLQIASLTGVPERTVRDRLRARGVQMRTRGRLNREDRLTVSAAVLEQLYVAAGLPAADIGRLLGVSRHVVLRAAHDEGLPVRIGGPEPDSGPADIELIEALYADPLVQRALSRHGIAPIPAGGAIWQRFPVPHRVGPELAEDLYVTCGLSVRHIELLTGQPSQTILRLLRSRGVARRPAGGRSPFLRRWREASSASPARAAG